MFLDSTDVEQLAILSNKKYKKKKKLNQKIALHKMNELEHRQNKIKINRK